jgi:hypothetical protein
MNPWSIILLHDLLNQVLELLTRAFLIAIRWFTEQLLQRLGPTGTPSLNSASRMAS